MGYPTKRIAELEAEVEDYRQQVADLEAEVSRLRGVLDPASEPDPALSEEDDD